MDPKSEKMIFIDYEGESTNYRLWDVATQKIYVSCNVDFNETTEEKDRSAENPEKEAVYQLSFGDDIENEEDAEVPQSSIEDISELLNNEPVSVGRQLRDRNKLREPDRYDEHCYTFTVDPVPMTYESAIASIDSDK